MSTSERKVHLATLGLESCEEADEAYDLEYDEVACIKTIEAQIFYSLIPRV